MKMDLALIPYNNCCAIKLNQPHARHDLIHGLFYSGELGVGWAQAETRVLLVNAGRKISG